MSEQTIDMDAKAGHQQAIMWQEISRRNMELEQQLAAITAERDHFQFEFERSVREHENCKGYADAVTAERDALRARIEEAEKQEPVATVAYPGADVFWHCTSIIIEKGDKLYAKPIPSPDTSELIRKAVEEEREACAQSCQNLANSAYEFERPNAYQCAKAIRARSTKETT